MVKSYTLKGHGNEADFLFFFAEIGSHRFLTVLFEPLRFWLRIRGDIHNRKTTPRLAEWESRRLSDLASRRLSDLASQGVGDSPIRRVGESMTCRLGQSEIRLLNVSKENLASRRLLDSASRGVANFPTRRAGESLWSRYSNFLKFIIKLQHFKGSI